MTARRFVAPMHGEDVSLARIAELIEFGRVVATDIGIGLGAVRR